MQALLNKSLFQIQAEHLWVLKQLEENEGELTPELEQSLELSKEDFETKAVSYGYIAKQFEANTEIIEKEIERLEALRDTSKKRKELFKSKLADAMKQFGFEKISTPTLTLSFRKSDTVEITDETKIPEEYIETKETKTPSKSRIKEALKEGVKVPGAELKTNKNLQIK